MSQDSPHGMETYEILSQIVDKVISQIIGLEKSLSLPPTPAAEINGMIRHTMRTMINDNPVTPRPLSMLWQVVEQTVKVAVLSEHVRRMQKNRDAKPGLVQYALGQAGTEELGEPFIATEEEAASSLKHIQESYPGLGFKLYRVGDDGAFVEEVKVPE